ncbi:vitamin K epoxide reductase family protein [Chloroflexus sp.]|uniref:vitamin K epoxide reductase family protein n=1 Tax=Chloroflexus sp. TaxID=1904827 RepID=UPI0026392ED6|nr:vitamin K epoxide reductase family protein [uncultured Chloroflexus sp.]
MRYYRILIYLFGMWLLFGVMVQSAAAQTIIAARAVLFFSPSCPHCHVVLNETLPPLQERYGDRLRVLIVDVTTPDGQALYVAALEAFAVPRERWGVPALFFEQRHLVGSMEIPTYLPALIEQSLAHGGNNWPSIPGLEPLTAPIDAGIAPAPAPETAPFNRDPLANSLALFVLGAMAISLVATVPRLRRSFAHSLPFQRSRLIPILAGLGLLLAGYLSWIELGQQAAVCGPIGDCNLVHQSPYARIAGIPVGVIGVGGYLAILVTWLIAHFTQVRRAWQTLSGLIVVGVLFSLYLTFLEPFVIGATCLWCLFSAITMTALLWLIASPTSHHVVRGRRPLTPAPKRH